MARAVRFDEYGEIDVLEVRDVARPQPGPGEVLVRVRAAGINPGENAIRLGVFRDVWPATFPSGQGSDLAGVVEEVGPDVPTWSAGDQVIGWVDTRASHAELVVVPAEHLVRRDPAVPWEVGGALFVAGTTAHAAVAAVGAGPGDTVVVAGAAGGVGSLAVQLARRAGATVIGLASERNHAWLAEHGVIPVSHGEGVADRVRAAAPAGIDAFVDTFGSGYVDLALELGVAPDRTNTIIDFAAAARTGVKAEGMSGSATAEVLGELAKLVAAGELEVPVAATYALTDVRAAYEDLMRRRTRGKIVLRP
ncbi:NADP-dependent oxidoreductase [Pseudonocardia kunmingensis]|uniref:NADPH:quinone reductase-like Zn-dependent oxidoreductase n=1 Tax=Pseudonocardia kunmingensis TaxID=630975 RepID=A0A543D4G3_9PSEU|nr:NADP-dependent oxidoreductase [Pseudonocardia kunmingensis]TQM04237.1 NADPH:quinone reductase-like Zn-dependent oxidoreductase [Pseudonocardia kunmingensis]